MSIQAVAWVLEHSEATLADRLVLIAIANHADARGWNAFPSVRLIGIEARCGRTTVFRALEALERSGELAVERRPGFSNMYGIAALMGSQSGTGEGSQIGTGGVPNTRKRGPKLAPKPLRTVKEPRCDVPEWKPEPLPAVDKERAKEWIRAIRNGETPA